jgi:hypothetical protein
MQVLAVLVMQVLVVAGIALVFVNNCTTMKKYLLILSILVLSGCGASYKPASFLKQTLSIDNADHHCEVASHSARARYLSDGNYGDENSIRRAAYKQCMYDQGYVR